MSKETEPLYCKLYREQIIKPKQNQRLTEQKGRTEASRAGFYNTQAWKDLRQRRLIENPLCKRCEQKGKLTAAKIVDHIEPIEIHPELALVYNNTQSLCLFCHTLKTNEDSKQKRQIDKLKQGKALMNKFEQTTYKGGGVVVKNNHNGKPQDRENKTFFQDEKRGGGISKQPFFVIGG